MRTAGGLFPRLVDPDFLDHAADKTVHGKRRRPAIAWFLLTREDVLARIAGELAAGTWRPSPFEVLFVREPKPRAIARAPVPDRVVHTALALLMEPAVLRSTLPMAFACREGLGTHRAVLSLWRLMRRHRFAVHLDVRAYFPSIDVGVLQGLLRRRVRDRRFLAVVDRVLEEGTRLYRRSEVRAFAGLTPEWPPPGRGLPIGARTSQLLAAQLYLDGLDHFVKRTLQVPGAVRYVDDLFLFGDRRADLREWRGAVGEWLERERRLRLKHPRARLLSCRGHLDALGYRVRREGVVPLPRVLRNLRARVARHMDGASSRRPGPDIRASVASSAGVVLFP